MNGYVSRFHISEGPAVVIIINLSLLAVQSNVNLVLNLLASGYQLHKASW